MNWDNVLLTILAVFGAAVLLLTQVREFLVKLTDVIQAWHEVRRSLHDHGDSHGNAF